MASIEETVKQNDPIAAWLEASGVKIEDYIAAVKGTW
jgi:hypothetical protein